MKPAEIWKTFYKSYQVSNTGKVRNLKTLTLLKQNIHNGYHRLRIGDKNFKTHRIVAQMFIPNPKNLPQVNHVNGNKTENHVGNLKWCDNRENTLHAFDNGLAKSGENHKNAKLTNQIVLELKTEYDDPDRETMNRIAKKLGVHWTTIRDIFSGKTWKRIIPTENK